MVAFPGMTLHSKTMKWIECKILIRKKEKKKKTDLASERTNNPLIEIMC